jgi:hypothetical protein
LLVWSHFFTQTAHLLLAGGYMNTTKMTIEDLIRAATAKWNEKIADKDPDHERLRILLRKFGCNREYVKELMLELEFKQFDFEIDAPDVGNAVFAQWTIAVTNNGFPDDIFLMTGYNNYAYHLHTNGKFCMMRATTSISQYQKTTEEIILRVLESIEKHGLPPVINGGVQYENDDHDDDNDSDSDDDHDNDED